MSGSVKSTKWGVYIGRFQPFHNGHLASVLNILDQVDRLIIFIGSSNKSGTSRNPWSSSARFTMIWKSIPDHLKPRVTVLDLMDLDDDESWYRYVRHRVSGITCRSQDVKIFGSDKDSSTYYLKGIGSFEFVEVTTNIKTDATTVRGLYFKGDNNWVHLVPNPVRVYLETSPKPLVQD